MLIGNYSFDVRTNVPGETFSRYSIYSEAAVLNAIAQPNGTAILTFAGAFDGQASGSNSPVTATGIMVADLDVIFREGAESIPP